MLLVLPLETNPLRFQGLRSINAPSHRQSREVTKIIIVDVITRFNMH
jgi:hypothetical protein